MPEIIRREGGDFMGPEDYDGGGENTYDGDDGYYDRDDESEPYDGGGEDTNDNG